MDADVENSRSLAAKEPAAPQLYYFMGFITASLIALLLFGFIAYRVGIPTLKKRVLRSRSEPSYREVMVLPKQILKELIDRNAVIENAGNPTQREKHNTVITQTDPELGYVLKPNAEIAAYTIRSIQPYNWEPPLLIIERKEEALASPDLRSYIENESILKCVYTTDSQGFRRTIPAVESETKILMIGDSVAFGVGVDDHQTIPSYLQQRLSNEVQVINAGVGGYSGRQAIQVAQKLSTNNFSGLIYVACQNDFLGFSETWIEEAEHLLSKLQALAPAYHGNVAVFFQTYMEYTMFDILREEGWEAAAIPKTEALHRHLARRCRELGFQFTSWSETASHYRRTTVSPFATFALYVDHCHLSALGNSMAADLVWTSIQDANFLPKLKPKEMRISEAFP